MARGTSLNFSSKRHHSFHWTRKVASDENDDVSSRNPPSSSVVTPKKKLQSVAIPHLRSVLASLGNKTRLGTRTQSGLGPRVLGTLFGSRRGQVHFAIQKDPISPPAFLVELATPISGLVKEMASGLVRIALECDKAKEEDDSNGGGGGGGKKTKMPSRRLVEEPLWRTFCNGKKCGLATRRDWGEKETKVFKAIEMVSMGAGVLPELDDESSSAGFGGVCSSGAGDVMYMRAKFERIVGSRDSEALYMMNPDSNGAPELSIYLLRI